MFDNKLNCAVAKIGELRYGISSTISRSEMTYFVLIKNPKFTTIGIWDFFIENLDLII